MGYRLLPNGEGTPPLHTPPPCDATIRAPSALDLTPQIEILDPPLSDTNRPDTAPIRLTVKPTKHVDRW